MKTLAEVARWLKPSKQEVDLPRLILVTDRLRLPDPEAAVAGLPRGSAVILRHYEEPARYELAVRLVEICRRTGVRLLIAGDARLAARVHADGLHLPEFQLAGAARTWRLWRRPDWLVTAAAHSPAAVTLAAQAGVDAVLLAPVFRTESHPNRAVLGPLRFSAWRRRSQLPVYALGGISPVNARRLINSGAAGFAGISGFDNEKRRVRPGRQVPF
jgi:thiamine-phosphate pyrophosphorylase